MFNWIRELLEIKHEFHERKLRLITEKEQEKNICPSCEVLKLALERSNLEKDRLLTEVLRKPAEEITTQRGELQAVMPRNIPWNIRRQMLEAEDRKKAELMKNAPTPNLNTDNKINEIEKELGINAGSTGSTGTGSL